jgi:thiamine phosphate synthase YjbQ (UPF0047 family)
MMSMTYGDWFEHGMVSDCCNANVFLNGNGICACCMDHCTAVFVDEDDMNNMSALGDYALYVLRPMFKKCIRDNINNGNGICACCMDHCTAVFVDEEDEEDEEANDNV